MGQFHAQDLAMDVPEVLLDIYQISENYRQFIKERVTYANCQR